MSDADLRDPDRRVTVAAYEDYLTAERAVDLLSDNKFPVKPGVYRRRRRTARRARAGSLDHRARGRYGSAERRVVRVADRLALRDLRRHRLVRGHSGRYGDRAMTGSCLRGRACVDRWEAGLPVHQQPRRHPLPSAGYIRARTRRPPASRPTDASATEVDRRHGWRGPNAQSWDSSHLGRGS